MELDWRSSYSTRTQQTLEVSLVSHLQMILSSGIHLDGPLETFSAQEHNGKSILWGKEALIAVRLSRRAHECLQRPRIYLSGDVVDCNGQIALNMRLIRATLNEHLTFTDIAM